MSVLRSFGATGLVSTIPSKEVALTECNVSLPIAERTPDRITTIRSRRLALALVNRDRPGKPERNLLEYADNLVHNSAILYAGTCSFPTVSTYPCSATRSEFDQDPIAFSRINSHNCADRSIDPPIGRIIGKHHDLCTHLYLTRIDFGPHRNIALD